MDIHVLCGYALALRTDRRLRHRPDPKKPQCIVGLCQSRALRMGWYLMKLYPRIHRMTREPLALHPRRGW